MKKIFLLSLLFLSIAVSAQKRVYFYNNSTWGYNLVINNIRSVPDTGGYPVFVSNVAPITVGWFGSYTMNPSGITTKFPFTYLAAVGAPYFSFWDKFTAATVYTTVSSAAAFADAAAPTQIFQDVNLTINGTTASYGIGSYSDPGGLWTLVIAQTMVGTVNTTTISLN